MKIGFLDRVGIGVMLGMVWGLGRDCEKEGMSGEDVMRGIWCEGVGGGVIHWAGLPLCSSMSEGRDAGIAQLV